ncbi:ribosomal protein S18-alanine N-acetyltransferase [Heliobacterium gestii]|uniref:Ribosomal protein S18-alanine N-acetyltransferase n=1 Tax=Heliomicrobium gestii TaxID=2699 RepID=A0A845LC98_HELGE|nr:ribosomal protein S18-alanine N-acetyltransferase [Heliomicrobium gestii]MBM7866133.1 ribosomal-protein-alanine N-acetyltransferase [Heliomicrobium gestii]MZP42540.1 ribosomal protein S18-alanine N-acetyltransferase [Heliomicrobium gestii]
MQKIASKHYFRPMTLSDVDEVLAIEQVSFPTPWSRSAFVTELTESRLSHYWVCIEAGEGEARSAFFAAQSEQEEQVIGYAGVWIILDEVHITTIAVHPERRGEGLGEAMLHHLFFETAQLGGERITLEVRPSNTNALALYRKIGFQDVGCRRGYYTDTGEDAIIMWRELETPKKQPHKGEG